MNVDRFCDLQVNDAPTCQAQNINISIIQGEVYIKT